MAHRGESDGKDHGAQLSFTPTAYDIEWLKTLVARMNVGGVWTAPLGFTFRKTAEKRLELQNIFPGEESDPAVVIDMINRTVVVGRAAGIEVLTEGCAEFVFMIVPPPPPVDLTNDKGNGRLSSEATKMEFRPTSVATEAIIKKLAEHDIEAKDFGAQQIAVSRTSCHNANVFWGMHEFQIVAGLPNIMSLALPDDGIEYLIMDSGKNDDYWFFVVYMRRPLTAA